MDKKNPFLGLTILLLLVVSAFSTYSWWQCREEKREMLVRVYMESELNRLELENMGRAFDHLLQDNASGDVLLLYIRSYCNHTYVVKGTFEILYLYSGEEKFKKLYLAVANLWMRLTSITEREEIQENLETLKKFDTLFKELRKYEDPFDIPDELAEEFFNTSKQLKL